MLIICLAKDVTCFATLAARLRREQEVELLPVATGAAGLSQLINKRVDLVVVDRQFDDMTGIDFVKHLVQVNPLANTAILGTQDDAAFHEATEGLGVLTQLSPQPTEAEAEVLLATMAKISGLLQSPPKVAGP